MIPHSSLTVPKKVYKRAGEGVLARACSDMGRGNVFKLKYCRFRWAIGRKITVWVVRHWNGFPREVGDTPSVELFNTKMGGALSN